MFSSKPAGYIINLTMMQKLARIYPPLIEFLPLLLLFLVIYLVVSSYPSLPARIPTHFNFQGLPDGWGSKGIMYLYPGLGAFVYILISGISLALILVHDPKTMINLPESMKEKIPASEAESLRSFIVRSLFALKLITMGLVAYLTYANLQVAFQHADSIGYWPFLFVFALLATVGCLLVRVFQLVLSDH